MSSEIQWIINTQKHTYLKLFWLIPIQQENIIKCNSEHAGKVEILSERQEVLQN